MLLYKGSCEDFIRQSQNDVIAGTMAQRFYEINREKPELNEVKSWKNSLKALSDVFASLGFKDQGIALEYQMPLSPRRLDCMITGKNQQAEDQAVIIELKQWSKCSPCRDGGEVITWVGGKKREVLHPSVQVGQYVDYLKSVNESFYRTNAIKLDSCAYLHNYVEAEQKTEPLRAEKFKEVTKQSPVFTINTVDKLKDFLLGKVGGGNGGPIVEKVVNSPARPNKKLMDNVAKIIQSEERYHTIDEQSIAVDKILQVIRESFAQKDESKARRCVIVKGGPGTGKTVIALHVLAEILGKNIEAHYAAGSKAMILPIRNVVRYHNIKTIIADEQAKQATAYQGIKNIFNYFNNFKEENHWGKDPAAKYRVILCDEAHRIRTGISGTRFNPNPTEESIDTMLRSSRVCVFFLDENQRVRPGENVTEEYIREHAEKNGFKIDSGTLVEQFRCGGSTNYLKWIDSLFGLSKEKNVMLDPVEDPFEFKICQSPKELYGLLKSKVDLNCTARLIAGFCWPWSRQTDAQGNLVEDVVIDDFTMPWNAHNDLTPEATNPRDRLPVDAPPNPLWAVDPRGFGQIGCIYTCQGLEFDYAGVIFGKDLAYDIAKNEWVVNRTENKDPSFKSKRYSDEEIMGILKNIYRTLLTRGMKGCYVYFLDKDTEEYFRSRIID